jgi:hypothetical protein
MFHFIKYILCLSEGTGSLFNRWCVLTSIAIAQISISYDSFVLPALTFTLDRESAVLLPKLNNVADVLSTWKRSRLGKLKTIIRF